MKIAITIGDPNGIGFETLIKSLPLLNEQFIRENELFLFGNIEVIKDYLENLKIEYILESNKLIINDFLINLENLPSQCKINFGKVENNSAKVAFESLEYAANCAKSKTYDALVTLPISKTAMHLAGFNFPGHTEYLAHIDSVENPLMILFNDTMKVALATIHNPISEVKKLISKELLLNNIEKFSHSLVNDFGLINPKIAVLGLNPHAGENGDIGNEEVEIIIPVLNKLIEDGAKLDGPFPADGFFGQHLYENFDGIFAMYHDQGLIPMKMTSLNGGVNFTAGLSFVRTSPDHGTGFNIAGKGIANPSSTLQSLLWSEKIFKNRQA
jgi:4-hydroxythreonine-4-phosphate dehydrogenase